MFFLLVVGNELFLNLYIAAIVLTILFLNGVSRILIYLADIIEGDK